MVTTDVVFAGAGFAVVVLGNVGLAAAGGLATGAAGGAAADEVLAASFGKVLVDLAG